MIESDSKAFKPSDEVDRVHDPYELFLNKRPKVQPVKGRAFYARLIAITATEFVFEGDRGMQSIYSRGQIRSMVLDENDNRGRC
jgi:hypothetical protein